MVTMKKAITACLATVMLLGCASCGSGSTNFGEKATLSILAPEKLMKKGGWIQTMEDAFSKEHPEVSFKNTPIKQFDTPYVAPNYKDTPKISADVFMYPSAITDFLAKKGIAGKLSKQSEQQLKKQNPDPLLNSVLSDGKYYGVPYTSNAWFMYYDKSKLSKNDVKSLNTILTKQKVAINLQSDDVLSSFYFDSCITLGYSKPGMNTVSSANFGENCYTVTKFLADLVKHKNFINAVSGTGIEALRKGKVAAYFSGIWEADEVKKILGKNFAAAPFPTVRTDLTTDPEYAAPVIEYQLKQNIDSQAIGYNAKSKHRELAEKFAAFLGSTESQKKAYELQKIVPSDKSLKSFVANDPAASTQMQTVEEASINQPLSNFDLFSVSYGFYRLEDSLYDKTLDENNIYELLNYMQENATEYIDRKLEYQANNK